MIQLEEKLEKGVWISKENCGSCDRLL